MESEQLEAWVQRYIDAWRSNDPTEIGALFTDNARYFTAPHRQPWQGCEEIVREWLGRKDDPNTWRFRFEIRGIAGDLGFVRGWTTYGEPPTTYGNLWEVRLAPDGRCREFVEWWMVEE